MKNVFVTLIILISMSAQSNAADQNSARIEEDSMRRVKAAQAEIYSRWPEMERLEKEYATDVEIQMGLAILYKRNHTGSASWTEKIEEQWKKVISLDPGNKTALATITTNNTQFYTARFSARLDDLEMKIEGAIKRGDEYITIQKEIRYAPIIINSKTVQTDFQVPLYQYFSSGDNKDIVISDFEAARKELKEKLTIELAESIETISTAEKSDPNNALYNYLKAQVFFEMGQNESGLEQVRTATKKQYLKTYVPEMRQAVSKVLEALNFPEQFRSIIDSEYVPFGQFINSHIITKGLEPLISQYKEQNQTKRIEEIVNMASVMEKQIRQEPMPYPMTVNRYGDNIKRWIDTR
jgi:hypothetical protein